MSYYEFIYSIGCNILASFIFIFLVLLLFKPKLSIAPFVCKYKYFDTDAEEQYFFKMVNWSVFSAYDVTIELLEVDQYKSPNGKMNDRFRELTLVMNKISHIPGYRPSWIRPNAPYAIRFRTKENLAKILKNDYKSVRVKVSLRHGLTGLVKVYNKDFADLIQVKTAKFSYGLKFGPIT
jgi:hypothetical protein